MISGLHSDVIGTALTKSESGKWAIAIVAFVGAASAILAWSDAGLGGASMALVITASGWLAWSALASLLGNWAFGAEHRTVSWWPLARAFGFAQVPGVIRLFGMIEPLGPVPVLAASGLQIIAMAVVVREAFGFSDFLAPFAILTVAVAPWLAIQVGIVFLLSPS